MLTEKLIPRLKERFPGRPVTFGAAPAPVAVFAAQHPQVGDVQIFDDGNELTVVAGNFTHGHFSDFDSDSPEEAERKIVEDAVQFLGRLFADRVVLWGSHRGSGGWYDRDAGDCSSAHGPLYVWSGPLPAGD